MEERKKDKLILASGKTRQRKRKSSGNEEGKQKKNWKGECGVKS